MSPEIRSRRFKGGASQFRKFFLIMKADRHLQLAVLLILAGGLLIGFSSQFIPPFVSQESYTIQMTNNPHNAGGGLAQVEELNIYAESPNYPIYININDSQQQTISYQIYFVNDTNLAVGFGPQKLIESGQFNGPVTLTIPNTVYHMSYLLKLSSPNKTKPIAARNGPRTTFPIHGRVPSCLDCLKRYSISEFSSFRWA